MNLTAQVKDDGDDIKDAPDIGCFINGMYLDGAVWCTHNHYLIEPKDGLLFDEMPTVVIYFHYLTKINEIITLRSLFTIIFYLQMIRSGYGQHMEMMMPSSKNNVHITAMNAPFTKLLNEVRVYCDWTTVRTILWQSIWIVIKRFGQSYWHWEDVHSCVNWPIEQKIHTL